MGIRGDYANVLLLILLSLILASFGGASLQQLLPPCPGGGFLFSSPCIHWDFSVRKSVPLAPEQLLHHIWCQVTLWVTEVD